MLGYHREDLGVEDAASIVASLGAQCRFFLITYLNRAEDVLALCGKLEVDMVQLHGAIDLSELEQLRAHAPQFRIIKSLVVRDDNREALRADVDRFSGTVDAFITDTFDPKTGATGATGKTHDWSVSAELVELSPVPVILAGGLNAENVGDAIAHVRPAGVDVHTGIEGADGRKRRDETERFVAAARDAFAEIGKAP